MARKQTLTACASLCTVCAGWDIAATSDLLSEWGKDGFGMCGMCLEVKCKNMGFKDGYVSARHMQDTVIRNQQRHFMPRHSAVAC